MQTFATLAPITAILAVPAGRIQVTVQLPAGSAVQAKAASALFTTEGHSARSPSTARKPR
jgi:hypothetical protein